MPMPAQQADVPVLEPLKKRMRANGLLSPTQRLARARSLGPQRAFAKGKFLSEGQRGNKTLGTFCVPKAALSDSLLRQKHYGGQALCLGLFSGHPYGISRGEGRTSPLSIGSWVQSRSIIVEAPHERGEETPHPFPVTRSRPLARPVAGLCQQQIPFATSQAAQVPIGWGEGDVLWEGGWL
jgi:hypothetical protein